jgi:hypothetical protein
MSWYLQNQVRDNAKTALYKSIFETAVMRELASFADDDGGSCFPSLATLAEQSQCSQSTVRRVLQQFKKRKWITIKHTGRSNHYRILPHGCVTPKPSNSRERVFSENIQNGQPEHSECSLRTDRVFSENNDSHHSLSPENAHQHSKSENNFQIKKRT